VTQQEEYAAVIPIPIELSAYTEGYTEGYSQGYTNACIEAYVNSIDTRVLPSFLTYPTDGGRGDLICV
jgi:hypothetical protein